MNSFEQLANLNPPGNPDALRRYWETGAGGQEISWGNPEEGDLTRCHNLVSKYMDSDQAWGFCQERKIAVSGHANSPTESA